MPDVEVGFADMPPLAGDALLAQRDDLHAILLGRHLGRRERNEALAHELVHIERHGGCPPGDESMPGWSALPAREERRVDAEVARRLLPLGVLAAYRDRCVAQDLAVTALDVAEEFDVTEDLASVALTLLDDRQRR